VETRVAFAGATRCARIGLDTVGVTMSGKRRWRRGLVVGKFAPLHRGHELVLDACQAACEELVVVSWIECDAVHDGVPTHTRRRWLQDRYLDATVVVLDQATLDEWGDRSGRRPPPLPTDQDDAMVHRRFTSWVCTEMLRTRIDVVFSSEDYGDALAAVLTERFRRHLYGDTPVAHVCVDRERRAVPISGTALRSMTVEDRLAWVAPGVGTSLVRRLAIVGGESTGKSTLAHAVAQALGTVAVDEYGRERWESQDGVLVFDDLLAIAREQVRRENEAAQSAEAQATGWIVCDTTPLTTLLYCQDLFGRVDDALVNVARRPYDLTILCDADFAFVQDGTRRDETWRNQQQDLYVQELSGRGIAFRRVGGSVEDRVADVTDIVRANPSRRRERVSDTAYLREGR
jgi:HTH-type transcriptional regulator, transcriptional repressor of NAD biosynthesis genes